MAENQTYYFAVIQKLTDVGRENSLEYMSRFAFLNQNEVAHFQIKWKSFDFGFDKPPKTNF